MDLFVEPSCVMMLDISPPIPWIGVVQGQGVFCYTDRANQCQGPSLSPRPATVQECCLGDGFFYQMTSGDEICDECLGERGTVTISLDYE